MPGFLADVPWFSALPALAIVGEAQAGEALVMPPVIKRLGANSRYVGGQKGHEHLDPTHSHVDPAAQAAYQQAAAPLVEADKTFVKLANRYTRGHNPQDALELQNWLSTWAQQDGLSDMLTTIPDHLHYAYALAALSSAYGQIKHDPQVAAAKEKNQVIEDWLNKRGREIAAAIPGPHIPPPNNIADWKSLATLQVAAATGDRELFETGMKYITIGLGDIDENGILKKESGRGARALQYQFFGAVPLVASATLAAKNGVDLYQVNHGALVRLVHMLLQNVDDNASFKSKTGIQELEPFRDGKVPQTHMGWLALVDTSKLSAEDNAKIAQLLSREAYQRLDLPALGGDVRLLYRGS